LAIFSSFSDATKPLAEVLVNAGYFPSIIVNLKVHCVATSRAFHPDGIFDYDVER
jgi:hypothetical protein